MPIDLLTLGAALLTGLLGGVHCVAMCGGIATSLAATRTSARAVAARTIASITVPAHTMAAFPAATPPMPARGMAAAGGDGAAVGEGRRMLMHAVALNGGRVLGYTLAGAIVGGFGGGLLTLARSDGLALGLRLAMGAVLLLAAARLLWPQRMRLPAALGAGFWNLVRPLQARLPAAGPLRPWLTGMLWGWLPCGLSTTLLAAAWLEASALHGALLMLAFGLGTTATMLPLTWSGTRITALLARRRWRHAAAALIATAGIATMAGPWLAHQPALHAALAALGCRSL